MSNFLTLMKDTYQNGETGDQVEGITLIVDGKIKEVFDTILSKSESYQDYTEVMRDVVLKGLNVIMEETK